LFVRIWPIYLNREHICEETSAIDAALSICCPRYLRGIERAL
jgi:hypothetical protein